MQNTTPLGQKPVPLWPALVAGALLLFLIYGAIVEHRRREAMKKELLDRYSPVPAASGK